MKLAIASTLFTAAAAFAPAQQTVSRTALQAAEVEEGIWDPLQLSIIGKNIDTFPNMFPDQQFVIESEVKHGRMAMLAWTGVWATHVGGMGLGMHIPGFPVEADWTKALGVFAAEQPAWFAGILAFISIAEGESVGHSGDNFRGKGSKVPGDLGLDYLGLKARLSDEDVARYSKVEVTQGRAAMIAMASLFAFESIPGSVPLMDLFGAQ